MADEQYRWLDRDTAERLLRGEPLDTVDAAVRDQAERLARALNALAADPYADASSSAGDLPGEAAALAAFRKATAARTDTRTSSYDAYRPTPAPASTTEPAAPGSGAFGAAGDGSGDAGSAVTGSAGAGPDHADAVDVTGGVVRIGGRVRPHGRVRAGRRSRRGRPVHLVLSAALAAGAVGGVAAAATTGVLPTPFGGDDPDPAASVSAPPTPGRPATTLSSNGTPSGTPSGAPDTSPAGGATAGSSAGAHDADTAGGGTGTAGPGTRPGAGGDRSDDSAGRRDPLALACHDLRDGKGLDAVRRHVLDGAAGGPARVWTYCVGVLKAIEGRAQGRGTGQGADEGGGHAGPGAGTGRGNGRTGHGGGHGGDGQGGDDEGHDPGGHPRRNLPRTDIATAPPLLRLLPKPAAVTSPAAEDPAAAPSDGSPDDGTPSDGASAGAPPSGDSP